MIALQLLGTGTVTLKDIKIRGKSIAANHGGRSIGLNVAGSCNVACAGTVEAIGGVVRGDSLTAESYGLYSTTSGKVELTQATGGDSDDTSTGAYNGGSGQVIVTNAIGCTAAEYSYGVNNESSGSVIVTTAKGGPARRSYGIYNGFTASSFVNATTATGGDSLSSSYGAYNLSSGTINVTNASGGTTSTAYSVSAGVYNARGVINVATATGGTSATLSVGVINCDVFSYKDELGTVNVGTARGGDTTSNEAPASYNKSCGIYNNFLGTVNSKEAYGGHGFGGAKSYGVCNQDTGTVNISSATAGSSDSGSGSVFGVFNASTGRVNAATISGSTISTTGVVNSGGNTAVLTLSKDSGAVCVLDDITVASSGATTVGTLPNVSNHGVQEVWCTDVAKTTLFSGTTVNGAATFYSGIPLAGTPTVAVTDGYGASSDQIKIGATLTATPNTTPGTNLSYQWQVSANGSTGWTNAAGTGNDTAVYTVAGADAAKYLRVAVNSTDAIGTVYSAASAQVPYTITLAQSGNTDTDKISFNSGLASTTTYAISGSVPVYYTLSGGGTLSNTLSYTGGTITQVTTPGTSSSTYTVSSSDATNGVISISAAFSHTDKPALTGTPTVAVTNGYGASANQIKIGATLTATPNTTPSTHLSYQWEVSANGTTGWTNAAGTGNDTAVYTVAGADAAKFLRVSVNSTDAVGTVYSAASAQVPYTITLAQSGNTGTDAVSFNNGSASTNTYTVSGAVAVYYTLSGGGTLSNTLSYTGGTITQVTTPGTSSSTYTVSSSDATGGTIAITAAFAHTNTGGGGTDIYTISADTALINFGSLTTGYATAPASQTVTITNTGNQNLTLTEPAITNASSNYTIGSLSDTALDPGDTATFTLQPKTGLAVGTYNETINVLGTSGAAASVSAQFSVTAADNGSDGGRSHGGGSTTVPPADTPNTPIGFNGQSENAGKTVSSTDGDQTVTTVTLDDAKIQEKIKTEDKRTVVSIPISGSADIGQGVLNGQTIKDMQKKESILEIKTNGATYTLPAAEINIDSVSSQLGKSVELKDIKISVKIAEPSADTAKIVQNTADKNSYQVVVKPVDFEITCSNGSKTVSVSKFDGYVERTVAIPVGIDPSKVTTGIVLNSDGTFSHVPTTIVKIDGKYYAKINSLTNSTYSVIYNPVEFADVAEHWAKASVNNMGSRLVISGVGDNKFEPNRDITRAEFAAIMVRALGLAPDAAKNTFSDVLASSWYSGYVGTAASYGIISGYDADTFAPNAKITREQAMTMVARAMAITKLDAAAVSGASASLSGYTDTAKISSYAKSGIIACLNTGVVTGKTADTIAPKNNITRAEVAVIIERLLKKSELI